MDCTIEDHRYWLWNIEKLFPPRDFLCINERQKISVALLHTNQSYQRQRFAVQGRERTPEEAEIAWNSWDRFKEWTILLLAYSQFPGLRAYIERRPFASPAEARARARARIASNC